MFPTTSFFRRTAFLFILTALVASGSSAQTRAVADPAAKAVEIVDRAVQVLGGDRYLGVKSQIGRGKFSIIKGNGLASFQSFTDYIVFPDRERTEFKGSGSRTVQVNTGDTGWVYDGEQDVIKVQNKKQVENFQMGIRTSLDNLLRGYWKGSADLTYVGRRPATLGKRNDVVRLTYKDGFAVEFEFADDGTPQKALYTSTDTNGVQSKDEDRYAQFIDVGGIKAPFIVDRFSDGEHTTRINIETIDFNRSISDAIFAKPANVKDAKREVKP